MNKTLRRMTLSLMVFMLSNVCSCVQAGWGPIDALFSPTIQHALSDAEKSAIRSFRGGASVTIGAVLVMLGFQEYHEHMFDRRLLSKGQKIAIGCELGGGLALILLSSLVAHID